MNSFVAAMFSIVSLLGLSLALKITCCDELISNDVKEDIVHSQSLSESWKKYLDVFYNTRNIYQPETMLLKSSGNGLEADKKRQQIFIHNLDVIKKHNKDFANGLTRSYLGVNKFTIMDDEELKSYTGILPGNNTKELSEDPPSAMRENLPESIDYVQEGYIAPVTHQRKCGSCYIFAFVAVLEYHLAKTTGRLLKLSEQELLDCCSDEDAGCRGGELDHAALYLQRDGKRLTTLKHLPYIAEDLECEKDKYPNALKGWLDGNAYELRSIQVMGDVSKVDPIKSDNILADSLDKYGPVWIGVNWEIDGFRHYQSGILDTVGGIGFMKPLAVVCVGYTPEYFNLRNAWGVNFGIKGYIRVARRMNVAKMYDREGFALVSNHALTGKDRESFWDNEQWWREYYEEEKERGNVEEYRNEKKRKSRGKDWWREELTNNNNSTNTTENITNTTTNTTNTTTSPISTTDTTSFESKNFITLGIITITVITAAVIQGANCVWIYKSAQRQIINQWNSPSWIVLLMNIVATVGLTVNIVLVGIFIYHDI